MRPFIRQVPGQKSPQGQVSFCFPQNEQIHNKSPHCREFCRESIAIVNPSGSARCWSCHSGRPWGPSTCEWYCLNRDSFPSKIRHTFTGHFGGILRYLGPVNGRQGIFCGVELDQPVGKNDGTHKGREGGGLWNETGWLSFAGTFYFPCRPGHGVFAPCHKVQPAEDAVGEENVIQSQGQSLGQKVMQMRNTISDCLLHSSCSLARQCPPWPAAMNRQNRNKMSNKHNNQ